MKANTHHGIESQRSRTHKRLGSVVRTLSVFLVFASVASLGFIELGENNSHWLQIDKLTHFLLFGLLTTIVLQFASQKESCSTEQFIRLCLIFLGMNAIGIIAESIHFIVPHRSFELEDMVANLLGINLLGLFYVGLFSFRSDLSKNSTTPEVAPINALTSQSLKIRFSKNRNRIKKKQGF